MARDLETTDRLTSEGWTVLRFWEHENAADVAAAIRATVAPSRGSSPR
jgi:DNA mismatch endonuclease (patch repair protein)